MTQSIGVHAIVPVVFGDTESPSLRHLAGHVWICEHPSEGITKDVVEAAPSLLRACADDKWDACSPLAVGFRHIHTLELSHCLGNLVVEDCKTREDESIRCTGPTEKHESNIVFLMAVFSRLFVSGLSRFH